MIVLRADGEWAVAGRGIAGKRSEAVWIWTVAGACGGCCMVAGRAVGVRRTVSVVCHCCWPVKIDGHSCKGRLFQCWKFVEAEIVLDSGLNSFGYRSCLFASS